MYCQFKSGLKEADIKYCIWKFLAKPFSSSVFGKRKLKISSTILKQTEYTRNIVHLFPPTFNCFFHKQLVIMQHIVGICRKHNNLHVWYNINKGCASKSQTRFVNYVMRQSNAYLTTVFLSSFYMFHNPETQGASDQFFAMLLTTCFQFWFTTSFAAQTMVIMHNNVVWCHIIAFSNPKKNRWVIWI